METIQDTLPASVLTKHQRAKFGPKHTTIHGKPHVIRAEVRFDDECGNGHNSFSITGDYKEPREKWDNASGGCIHEEIEKAFPELAPLIKWHLCSTDGPMHYIANTIYHVEQGKLDYARSSAIWPEITDDQLLALHKTGRLSEALILRLPALMIEFRAAVESLGFTY